ncbi:hypothetical protein [Sulfuracidifex tepidarius]|uniref:HEPN domain-containing protein n=1 Tax=Sulfuracidifex tepidarius TaxID=1294262 RepID=A0A510E0D4_9CREN|nr:hypothetical protein [Sulfuracidifex tepidarius]BBG25944.1 hypothetical protein IC007_0449 [Sulfuracidifex tepidarius]
MRPSNTGDLKPHKLISYFENILNDNLLDEVFIRRMISAVYFSLFNYWSIKNICKGIKGKGKRNDSFPHVQFIQDLVGRGFDAQIRTIYLYRVAVDHYTLNQTTVTLTSNPYKGKTQDVEIGKNALKRVLESAKDILNFLDKY